MVTASIITIAVALLATLSEWLHQRRSRRARTLAFAQYGDPASWTAVVPLARVLALSSTVFGCVLLVQYRPDRMASERSNEYSQRLLICLDVSPSMYVKDAGNGVPKQMRSVQAYEAVRPLLDTLDPHDTRVTVTAFYTKTMPVLTDTYDFNLVRNVLNALPLYNAFKPGDTDLIAGVRSALDIARPWARGSATLLVISDGDSNAVAKGPLHVPPSIAETIVVGVGDIARSSKINNRHTRQDAASLRSLALRLGGEYIDCNQTVLPPRFIHRLSMQAPEPPVDRKARDIGLASAASGALLSTIVGPMLLWFGRRHESRTDKARNLQGALS
ncbi:MAG: hypothetical protein DRJ50_13050 [Actinobacteria bacterium]|nr:MAG: hypothetical protein DRJ50_13050 [Actinomycetota bacterium]